MCVHAPYRSWTVAGDQWVLADAPDFLATLGAPVRSEGLETFQAPTQASPTRSFSDPGCPNKAEPEESHGMFQR